MGDDFEDYVSKVSGMESDDSNDTMAVDTTQDTDQQENQQQQRQDGGDTFSDDIAAAQRELANKQPDGTSQQPQGKTPDNKAQQPNGGQTQDQQQAQAGQAPAEELRPIGGGNYQNNKGDIVNQKGELIATSSFANRMFHSLRRTKSQLDNRTREYDELAQRVGDYRVLSENIQRSGLESMEVAQAIDLASRMKRGDAIGVAREVISMLTAQGHNVTDLLGAEVGDSIEMRGIRQMLDERLGPIHQAQQSQQQEAQRVAQATRAYESFVMENEFADVHADDIVKVMKDNNVKPQQAYNMLVQFAARNGLDFSRPLAPQIQQITQARQQQQQQGRSGSVPANQTQQRPLPNGAGNRAVGSVPAVAMAGADDDWASIISGAMATGRN